MKLNQKHTFEWAGPYRIFVQMTVVFVLIMTLSRAGLMAWQWQRVSATGSVLPIFIQGVRADLILTGLWLIMPILLSPIFFNKYLFNVWNKISLCWAMLGILLVLFIELATPNFLLQYDLRPNLIFVEYLKYPKEVFSTLWNGFRVGLLLGISASVGASYGLYKALKSNLTNSLEWSFWKITLVWPLALIATLMMARSTLDHRPANPAMFAITHDAMVNSLVINSTYSVLFAVYSMKNESKSSDIYGRMELSKVLEVVKSEPWLKQYQFSDDKLPTYHLQMPTNVRSKPYNLVIILEESLGATFVQSLGGVAVTPNLERLKQEGWWFTQLYATGTRSVRGIEAVVSGYLPTPAQSVVKLPRSQRDFYTIASSFERAGLDTEFIYGGESHFDNMRSFFAGNGIKTIIEQKDFVAPKYVGSWGVSDEDLYNKTHERLIATHKMGKPFFKLVFSSSNHEPFDFPDRGVRLHNKHTVNDAVKYADYALGKFFDKARKSEYWQDTVFLVVADHDNRVYGNALVPIKKFHIPGLILGGSIKPKRINSIVSQVDLAPTLLSLIGMRTEHPMIGRDLTVYSDYPGRAMMQFDNYYAWLEGKDVVILRAEKPPLQGRYDAVSGQLTINAAKADSALVQKALAHAQLPSLLYRNSQYKASPRRQ